MRRPLLFEWNLLRSDRPTDPHGFEISRHTYLRSDEGAVSEAELDWQGDIAHGLEALLREGPDSVEGSRARAAMARFAAALGCGADLDRILAASREGHPWTLRLRFAAAELYGLPWECLPVGPGAEPLGLLPGGAVTYASPQVRPRDADAGPRPTGGRILVAAADCNGGVPLAAHIEAISAVSFGGYRFRAEPVSAGGDVLHRASRASLTAALAQGRAEGRPFAVLHLLCHGLPSEAGGAGGAALSGEDGGTDIVGPETLRALLAPYAGELCLVLLMVCSSGDELAPPTPLGSLASALHREGLPMVIGSRLPLRVDASNALTAELYRHLLLERSSLEVALLAGRRAALSVAGLRDALALQLYSASPPGLRPFTIPPYRGLLPFEPHHAGLFFGRDAETAELAHELGELAVGARPSLMFVIGASGAGKSSLVRAGLIPALARRPGPRWTWELMTPGADPEARLAALLGRAAPEGPRLLVIDQLEELFTHVEQPEPRERFVRELWRLAGTPEANVHIVAVLRVEHLARCAEIVLPDDQRLDGVAYQPAHHVFVSELARDRLEEVIARPLEVVGMPMQAGLADVILEELGARPSLPLLQFALKQLWKKRTRDELTLEDYRAIGGVTGALSQLAERLWAMACGDEGESALAARLLRRVLVGLVASSREAPPDTRLRVPLSELAPPEMEPVVEAAFDRTIDLLVRERLIVRSRGEDGTALVEFAHEALIRAWSRLREWVDLDRVRLDQLAWLRRVTAEWQQHGEARLLRDDDLRQAQRIVARWAVDVLRSQRALVEASEAADAARRAAWERELRTSRDLQRMEQARLLASDPTRVLALLAEVEAPAELAGWRQAVVHALGRPRALAHWEISGQELVAASAHPYEDEIVAADARGGLWRCRRGAPPERLEEGEAPLVALGHVVGGSALVTVDQRGEVRRWSPEGPDRSERRWSWSPGAAMAAIDPAGGYVLLAAADGRLALLDLRTGAVRWELPGAGAAPMDLSLDAQGARAAIVWAVGQGAVLHTVGPRPEPVALALSGDTVMLARPGRGAILAVTGSWGGAVHRWDASGERTLLHVADDPICAIELDPHGRHALIGARNSSVALVQLDGTGVRAVSGGARSTVRVAFRDDGAQVATATSAPEVRLVDVASGEALGKLGGLVGDVVALSFLSRRGALLTASAAGAVRLWPDRLDRLERAVCDHAGTVRAVCFSPDGRSVVSCSADGTARLTPLDPEIAPRLLDDSSRGGPLVARYSPDGRTLLTVSREGGAVMIWALDDPGPPRVIDAHQGDVKDAAFDPGGRWIATAGDDALVRLWPATLGGAPIALSGHSHRVVGLRFSLTGDLLLSASWDNTARLWSLQRPGESWPLAGHTDAVHAVAVSPDGRFAATASGDRTARLWRVDGGAPTCAAILSGHRARVYQVEFHPFEPRLVTASADGSAAIWTFDAETGALTSTRWLRGHSAPLFYAGFAPTGGERVITVSSGGSTRVWTPGASGEHDGVIISVLSPFRACAWSPDGRAFATGDADGRVAIWDARVEDLEARLAAEVGRAMAPAPSPPRAIMSGC